MIDVETRIDDPVRLGECATERQWWAREYARRAERLARFEAIENHEKREQVFAAERLLCSLDPYHWIEQYVWIQDPHRTDHMRDIPLVMWPAQRRIVEAAEKALTEPKGSVMADVVTIKPREFGVSWTFQAWFYWRFGFHPFKGLCLSAKEDKVDDRTPGSLFGKFRYIHARLPAFLQPNITRDTHMHLERDEGVGVLVGDSTSKDALRGDRGDAILADEFAAIETAKQEQVFLATETVTRARFFVSTAQGPGNRFAKLVSNHPNVLRFSYRDDPRRSEEWAAAKRDSMGQNAFDQEYGGKVVALDGALIWTMRKSVVRYDDGMMLQSLKRTNPLVSGWDFGSGPSLLIALHAVVEYRNDGSFGLWIEDEQAWRRTDATTAAQDCLARIARFKNRDWTPYGDPTGINVESNQQSWERNLRAAGVPMICLPAEIHDREQREWCLMEVQKALSDGRLRVHDRCAYLWATLERWSREIPHGREIDDVSKAYISPKHDGYSHAGWALVYLWKGAQILVAARQAGRVQSEELFAALGDGKSGAEMARKNWATRG